MFLVIDLLKLLSNFAGFYNFNFVSISIGLYKASALSNASRWMVLMTGVIRMTPTDCKQYSYRALAVGQSQPLLCIALSHIQEYIALPYSHSSANACQPYSFLFLYPFIGPHFFLNISLFLGFLNFLSFFFKALSQFMLNMLK